MDPSGISSSQPTNVKPGEGASKESGPGGIAGEATIVEAPRRGVNTEIAEIEEWAFSHTRRPL
jgi:hypothetical protein